jgi:hypothetical protein
MILLFLVSSELGYKGMLNFVKGFLLDIYDQTKRRRVGKGADGWVKRYGGVLVFGCISIVVVEDVCVRDCRGLGLCAIGTVG